MCFGLTLLEKTKISLRQRTVNFFSLNPELFCIRLCQVTWPCGSRPGSLANTHQLLIFDQLGTEHAVLVVAQL